MERILQITDILNVIEKHGARLVAGISGVKRVVKCLDVLEQPQIEGWVREGAFFISTGYAVRNDKDALLKLVQVLFDRSASGLAIKTRFFREFPNEALDLSNQLNFPLILIEDSVSSADIIYSIMETLLNAKNSSNDTYLNPRDENDLRMLNTHLFLDIAFLQIEKWYEMEYRIHALHWPDPPVRLACIRVDGTADQQFVASEKMDLVYDEIRKHMRKKKISTVVILKNDECICIFPENARGVYKWDVFNELRKDLENRIANEVYIGISSAINDYKDIHYAYEDTRDAIKIGRVSRVSKKVIEIEAVQFEQALLRTSKDPYFQQRAYAVFSAIEQYDIAHDSNMMETLEIFISNSGVRKAAAEQLFLHRNTMTYRIKKIEELINVDLANNQDLMLITLLLNIRNYL